VNYGLINVAATARCFAASIAVNGGFFDTRSGKALGFVVDQQRTLNTPVLNPSLKRFSKKIINRSEFREIDLKDGSQQFTIAPHDAPLPADALLQESLQAGPQLLPDYNPGLEAFKRPGRNGHLVDVINTSLPENRTAIGITADDKLIIVTVSNAALGPDSAGATLLQLADILESLGAVHALNLDGGSSTTMYLRLADSGKKSHEYGVPKAAHMRLVSTVLLLQPH
jgi:exopolysaccharide biosynthesis protein